MRNDENSNSKLAKEKVVTFECKIQWNTLLNMLEKFLEILRYQNGNDQSWQRF